ncbi:MAG: hypothetical protein JW991_00815 [Candidatus Pacebacteria bacterium]|nr:hypothetical protein [Candidatus Paceibacterota bacterium]
MKQKIPRLFWWLLLSFIFGVAQFFLEPIRELFRGTFLFLLPLAVFSFLGFGLIIVIRRRKFKNRLKKFLLLSGVSAAAFFPGVVFHNLLYALAIITEKIQILHFFAEALHVTFFLTSTIVCPLGFLTGAVGVTGYFFSHRIKKRII